MHWHKLSKFFHWLMAALIFATVALGLLASGWQPLNDWLGLQASRPTQYLLYMLHKSCGISILALAILRLFWRVKAKRPPTLASHTRIERLAAEGVHLLLYGLLFALPLSGWILNSAKAFPFEWFGLFDVPSLVEKTDWLAEWSGIVHYWLNWLLALLLVMHIFGALKHHALDRDETLLRMLPTVGYKILLSIIGLLALTALCLAITLFGLSVFEKSDDTRTAVNNIATEAPVVRSLDEALDETSDSQSSFPVTDASTTKAPLWVVADHPDNALAFHLVVMGEKVSGRFDDYQPTIYFSSINPSDSYVSVVINTQSADTDSQTRDELLPNSDWLHIKEFPRASFTATQFKQIVDNQYSANAELTIRGQTQKFEIQFNWQMLSSNSSSAGELPNNQSALLTFRVPIKRLDYQIGEGDWSDPDTVSHEVVVDVNLHLKKI